MFNFSVLDQKNPESNERGREKNTLKKNKIIKPIFKKINEREQMKKTLDTFLEKLMRAKK